MLVVFAAYLDDPGFSPGSNVHVPFDTWCDARPELASILRRLLRTNPLAALSLDRPPAGAAAAAADGAGGLEDSNPGGEQDEYSELVSRRGGSVLGPHTILKQDHFPGCQSARLPAVVDGAPNFRGAAGGALPVFGGAIPTVDGVRRVLQQLGTGAAAAAADAAEGPARAAVWHVMREEPVLYIGGQPYVLREDSRPFKNLMEYRGIDAGRLDEMEQRLKVGGRVTWPSGLSAVALHSSGAAALRRSSPTRG
jgi:hypothetical protein